MSETMDSTHTPTGAALADVVALRLTRKHLAGLRHWPLSTSGQELLARTVQSNCLSVAHAEATLAHFEHLCPTPAEIKAVAWNSERANFEPPPKPLKEQWESAGATYDASFYQQVTRELASRGKTDTSAELWIATKKLLRISDRDAPRISWEQLKSAKRHLGFPLNSHEREYAHRWDREHPNAYASVEAVSAQDRNRPVIGTATINGTAADVTAANFQDVTAKPWRCPSCNGLGRTDTDAYCGCEIGRDLQRQEQRDQIT